MVHTHPPKAGAPMSMSHMAPNVWASSWPTHGPSIINLILLAIPAPYISRISLDLHLSKWTGPLDQNKVKSHLSTSLNLRPTNQGITVIHYLFDWSDLDLSIPHPWLVGPLGFLPGKPVRDICTRAWPFCPIFRMDILPMKHGWTNFNDVSVPPLYNPNSPKTRAWRYIAFF